MSKLFKDETAQAMLTEMVKQSGYMSNLLGNLTMLKTGTKTSLIAAINELVDNRGSLSGLSTSAKNTIVAAINEIYAYTELQRSSGAGRCNSYMIGNGRNLGTAPTAAHYAAMQDGSFAGMQVGDYWTRTITYNYTDPDDGDATKNATITPVMRIGDASYLYRSGDTDLTKNGLIIVPDANLFTAPMNPTNTTEGAYVGSKMRTKYLARAEAIFNAFFGAEHVVSYRGYLQNAVTNGKPSAGAWYDCKVELMSEPMVYGGYVFTPTSDGETIPNIYTVLCKQLSLFRLRPDMISNRQWYWLMNVVSAAWFALVRDYGDAHYYGAGLSGGGVRPFAFVR